MPLTVAPRRRLLRRIGSGIGSLCEWCFGAVTLVLGLSVLAVIPVLQFLSLGYLLESGGRVARTGRLRNGVIGVRKAARVGAVVFGFTLVVLVLQFFASLVTSAELIDPGGAVARRSRAALAVLTVLFMIHLIAAGARGGKLRHFLWPFTNPFWLWRQLRRGGFYPEWRDALWNFVTTLRLPYYFRLGLLGFVGTMAWLVVPVTLIAIGRRATVIGLLGGLLLGVVALAIPFLQMRFAAEGRFRGLFEYRAVRDRFKRAPWAFAAASFLTLWSAVPLYLFKIEMIPRETAWLPSLLFILFIFPARVLTGWAYARSGRREQPRHWFFRGTSRLWMLPTAAVYVLIVFLTQFTAWKGIWSLYEQHAFLMPVPFLNM